MEGSTSVLAYDVHGPDAAPVVVLGSSLGTDRTMWDELLPALSGHFRVVRYDHLGHGASAVPAGPYTVERLGDEVLTLLDALAVDAAHLGGLSLGGAVAMQVAAQAPERVRSLALVCTAASFPPPTVWRERAATVRSAGMTAVADGVFERWFTPAFAGSPRAQELRRALTTTPPEGYAACCEALAEVDLRPRLTSVQVPALVVAGRDDPATPPERGQEIVDLLGGPARLEVVDDAAHLASVEQPDRVGELLAQHVLATR